MEITWDEIIVGLLFLNMFINIYLLYIKNKTETDDKGSISRDFWQGYLLFVPFFVTKNIIEEMKKKDELRKKKYENIIDCWKTASKELNIKIQVPFILKDNNKEIAYPILIEDFGSKSGVILLIIKDDLDTNLPKRQGYLCSYANPYFYSKYNKRYFIDILNSWGYYGDIENKPHWYTDNL